MKKIVLLSDGTGNGAAKRHKTNVWRLYDALDLHRDDQIAMYDDGVGSQEFLLLRILGGAFGWGFKRNVIELYKFLCRNYVTSDTADEGDKIYLFGFSRGAFTVRVLAGLINTCGLIQHHDSEQELHKIAHTNYAIYRENYRRYQLASLFSRIRDRKHLSDAIRPKIEFIGVWDTVDAYGLPFDELADLWNKFIYPMRFRDLRLSDLVLKACHAISIDDERHTFHPILWNETEECNPDRIEQVWFAGVHSDVGGGYPRNGLSLVSLDWMMSKVEASRTNPFGVNFLADLREQYRRRSDCHGIQHNSRAGLRAYYRYRPRNIEELFGGAEADATSRTVVPRIHRSVFERIRGRVVPYAPTGIPKEYQVVTTRGGAPDDFENDDAKSARISAMKLALDVISWRRWLYRLFLATTLVLIASPALFEWEISAPCVGLACLLDPVCVLTEHLLPDLAVPWVTALCQNPGPLVILAAFYLILWVLNRYWVACTHRRATLAWSAVKEAGKIPEWPTTMTSRLREISAGVMGQITRRVWWWVVFVILLAVIVVAADWVLFHVRDSVGWLCLSSSSASPVDDQAVIDFDTSEPCKPTGVEVLAGTTYRFEVKVSSPWKDGSLLAGPGGLEDAVPLSMKAFALFRRQIRRPWFELTGRVGRGEAFAIGAGTCYTAKSDGELYFYVNDAVSGFLPGKWWAFSYFWSEGPNCGKAKVTVTAIGESSKCDRANLCRACAGRGNRLNAPLVER